MSCGTLSPMTTLTGTVHEGSDPVLLNRVVDYTADDIDQAAIISLDLIIRDMITGEETANQPVDVASVIFDTLQTPPEWTVDDIGYNFRHQLDAAWLPNGNTRYLVQYRFTDIDGNYFYMTWELTTVPTVFD